MKNIAFVVLRYGAEINGGAEYHCRMLAERLLPYYKVSILTTCVKDYKTLKNEYPEGIEQCNGVMVFRFPVNTNSNCKEPTRIKIARKIRRLFFRLKLIKFINCFFDSTSIKQLAYYEKDRANSSHLLTYLKRHKDTYDKIIFITYLNPLTILGIDICKDKSILIPTAHNESALFQPILKKTFKETSFIAFNTKAEQVLCNELFVNDIASNSIVGVGINLYEGEDWEFVEKKYSIDENYILYIGRLDNSKMGELIPYFKNYKNKYNDNLKLIIVGALNKESIILHPDIIYTGFVSEEIKITLICHCKVFLNPSKYESLSLVLLEAMNARKPVLVNGKCQVLKEHILNSKAGFYYENGKQFNRQLRELLSNSELCEMMGARGNKYVDKFYNWNNIIPNFRSIIDS